MDRTCETVKATGLYKAIRHVNLHIIPDEGTQSWHWNRITEFHYTVFKFTVQSWWSEEQHRPADQKYVKDHCPPIHKASSIQFQSEQKAQ